MPTVPYDASCEIAEKEFFETWSDVRDCNGIYQVSDLGRVRSRDRTVNRKLRRGRVLTPVFTRRGYCRVALRSPGRTQLVSVHALVAEAFIGPRPDGLQINHINGVKNDNRAVNLEYVTCSDNHLHAYRTGLRHGMKGPNHPMYGRYGDEHPSFGKPGSMQGRFGKEHNRSRPVEALIGDSWFRFGGQMEAERVTGIDHTSISHVCRGVHRRAGGYQWRYAN